MHKAKKSEENEFEKHIPIWRNWEENLKYYENEKRFPKWKWDDYSGVRQITPEDDNNMVTLVVQGTSRAIKDKINEWDERGLYFSDIKEKKKFKDKKGTYHQIKFHGNVWDFDDE